MSISLAGLLAGFVHVLSGPDHLAAIAPYALDGKRRAWRTGVRWGVGHASGALAVGLLLLALREALPVERISQWGERFVGLALIVIGFWGLRRARARGTHGTHNHGTHAHGSAAFAIGTLHGLAGSAHLLGMLPALALPTEVAAGSYLLLFGAGSVAAMAVFASLIGWVAIRPGVKGPRAQSALLGLSSLLAIGVGCFWLLANR